MICKWLWLESFTCWVCGWKVCVLLVTCAGSRISHDPGLWHWAENEIGIFSCQKILNPNLKLSELYFWHIARSIIRKHKLIGLAIRIHSPGKVTKTLWRLDTHTKKLYVSNYQPHTLLPSNRDVIKIFVLTKLGESIHCLHPIFN